jgi:hypothetical protein
VNLSLAFRALKYRDTKAGREAQEACVIEAWAGSFEALLSKDMSGVNTRPGAECRSMDRAF